MKDLIAQFDYARIINVRDRTDRRAAVIQEFQKQGIDIPHKNLDFYTSDRFKDSANFPNPGVRGCYTSHREILREAIAADAQNVLIFEDDLKFTNTTVDAKAIRQHMQQEDWDIIYFGYLEPTTPPIPEPAATPCLIPWSKLTIGGHFYALNRSYMEKMLVFMDDCAARPPGHPEGGPMYRDGCYNLYAENHPELKKLICTPNLAVQRGSKTDLGAERFYDKVPVLRSAAALWRKLVA